MKKIFAILSAFLALVISGCASTPEPSQGDRRFGAQVPPPPKATPRTPSGVAPAMAERAEQYQPKRSLSDCRNWVKLTTEQKKSKGYFCWKVLGGNPYQGTPEQAVEATGWPTRVKAQMLGLIRDGRKSQGLIEPGDFFDGGTFGKVSATARSARYHPNVIADFGRTEAADKWVVLSGGTQYTLLRAHSCNNYNWNSHTLRRVEAPDPEPAQAIARVVPQNRFEAFVYTVEIPRDTIVITQPRPTLSVGVGIAMGGGYNTGYSGHYGHGQSSIWSGNMPRPIGHPGGGIRPVQRPLNLPSYTMGQPIGMNVGGVAPNTGGFIIPQTVINPITGIPGGGQGPQTGTFTIPGGTIGMPIGDTSGGVFGGGGTFGGPSVYTGPIYYYGGGGGPNVYTNPSTGGTSYYYGGSPGVMTNQSGGIYFGGGAPGAVTGGSGSLGVTTNPIGGGTPGAVTGSSGPGVSTGSSGPSVTQ